MSWAHLSQIHKDTAADTFALIFANEQYDGFLECLAQQIALHEADDAKAYPVRVPSKIRLLSKSFGNGSVPTVDSVQTLDVEMMIVSIQTADRHLCYLELFNHQRGVSENLEVPLSYDVVHAQLTAS
jgi:hypothetical protein